MISLNPSLVVVFVWSVWTSGCTAAGCTDLQADINGRCCDLCPPGTHLKKFCSETNKTVCSPCGDGYFSPRYAIVDRCTQCRSCEQKYADECTATKDANCSCNSGFLCSDNVCSQCVENKCIMGEKVVRTGQEEYSYQCESCPDNLYLDVIMDICKPWTQCNKFGLVEQFPGNKTHDSICVMHETHSDGVFIQLTLLCFLSVTILLLISHLCFYMLRKYKANKSPVNRSTVTASSDGLHLSKEESGLQLIHQDESSNSKRQLHLEIGTAIR